MSGPLLLSVALAWAFVSLATSMKTVEPTEGARIGFKPSMFGPMQWRLLHLCALNLPKERGRSTERFKTYLIAVAHVLPCKSCRDDFCDLFDRVNVDEFLRYGRVGAIALMYVLHTIVSVKLGKRIPSVFEEEEKLLREYTLDITPEQIPVVMAGLRRDLQEARGLQKLMSKYLSV